MAKSTAQATHERQQNYIDDIEKQGFDYGPVVAQAFVRSIRDLGYRSVVTAVDELIDNSIEAGAQTIHVTFGYDGRSNKKPDHVAILDDGYGMVPGMIRAAMVWGGTDREGSRDLFGRYGYGLPSASVSQGQRFTVYSRTDDGPFYAVTMDLEELRDGAYIKDGRVVVPAPQEASLPEWVEEYAENSVSGGSQALRTVVVWSKLDRITWKTTNKLEMELLHHLGLVYRGFLRQVELVVDGTSVEPIDPLFASEGARYYDYDAQRAEALPPLQFNVKASDGKPHPVRLRVSYMPFGFLSEDKSQKATRKNRNPRFNVRKDNNGLIVCRNGRQIDVISRTPITTFQNNDRYIGLELDFPAALDEQFGVTTAKQQITISDTVWDLLAQHGFKQIMQELRRRYKEDQGDAAASQDLDPEARRASEKVMAEADSITRGAPPSTEQEEKAQANLDEEVDRVSEETGLDQAAVRRQKEEEAEYRPFKVQFDNQPGAAFYRVSQLGGQTILHVNRAHRFFTDVYSPLEGVDGARIRAALELLLFVLGRCELSASSQGSVWYMSERAEWSNQLNMMLTLLEDHVDFVIDDDLEDADIEEL